MTFYEFMNNLFDKPYFSGAISAILSFFSTLIGVIAGYKISIKTMQKNERYKNNVIFENDFLFLLEELNSDLNGDTVPSIHIKAFKIKFDSKEYIKLRVFLEQTSFSKQVQLFFKEIELCETIENPKVAANTAKDEIKKLKKLFLKKIH